MKVPDDTLLTPLYVKTRPDFAWPDDAVFYLMTGDGLFLCRNHPFFSSCVPAKRWPSELAYHDPFLVPRYPKLSRRQIEEVVGFFARVATLHGSEAGVIIAWDRTNECTQLIAPEQVATISRNRWGDTFAIGLDYETPPLPADWSIIGDIHSHVDMAAYSSHVDQTDEKHRAGLHIVVGRIHREPPDFHIEAVVDGNRFTLEPDQVFDGYRRRRASFDSDWLNKIRVKGFGSHYQNQTTTHAGNYVQTPQGETSKQWSYSNTNYLNPAKKNGNDHLNGGYKVPTLQPAKPTEADAVTEPMDGQAKAQDEAPTQKLDDSNEVNHETNHEARDN